MRKIYKIQIKYDFCNSWFIESWTVGKKIQLCEKIKNLKNWSPNFFLKIYYKYSGKFSNTNFDIFWKSAFITPTIRISPNQWLPKPGSAYILRFYAWGWFNFKFGNDTEGGMFRTQNLRNFPHLGPNSTMCGRQYAPKIIPNQVPNMVYTHPKYYDDSSNRTEVMWF